MVRLGVTQFDPRCTHRAWKLTTPTSDESHPGRTVRWPQPWRGLSQLWRRRGRLKVGQLRSTRLAEQSLLNAAQPRPDRHRGTFIASLLIRPQRFQRSRPGGATCWRF
jgi:hypothetical protein